LNFTIETIVGVAVECEAHQFITFLRRVDQQRVAAAVGHPEGLSHRVVVEGRHHLTDGIL